MIGRPASPAGPAEQRSDRERGGRHAGPYDRNQPPRRERGEHRDSQLAKAGSGKAEQEAVFEVDVLRNSGGHFGRTLDMEGRVSGRPVVKAVYNREPRPPAGTMRACPRSSIWQSRGLLIPRFRVRIPTRAPDAASGALFETPIGG